VSKVLVGGRVARWQHRAGKLHVSTGRRFVAGREVEIEVRYSGRPQPVSSPWGAIGWEELSDGVLVASQPSGASSWFPCNDLADRKASFGITVTAPRPYRAVACGDVVEERLRGSATTWTFEQPEPTSPYLVPLHVGRYDVLTVTEVPVPFRAVVANEHRRAFDLAFGKVPRMLDAFIERFGPYPLAAGYTVVVCADTLDIPVEAQGQAAFGVNHLAGDHERLVAHELAHQWFGNSVTAASWRDIWLHEGFACYAEWLWSEASGRAPADELATVHHRRVARARKDLLLADPGPASMFDDRVYKRGALALHALRRDVGDDTFFHVLREWSARHRHAVATTEMFVALASETAGRDVDGVVRPWLHELALPAITW